MRTVHICEKCGKQFDDFNAAYDCEASHKGFGLEFELELERRMKWSPESVLPEIAYFASTPVSKFTKDTVARDGGDEGFVFGIYELKRCLTEKEVLKIYAEHDKRVAEEQAAFEAYVRQETENARIRREVAEENERSNEE